MRKILFRGRRLDNGEWTFGTPFFGGDSCKMIFAVALHPDFVDAGNVYYSEGHSVDPSTVGQFTGLTGKNGVKIFEGDVVHLSCAEGEWEAVVTFGNPNCFYSYGWQLKHIKGTHFNKDILLWVEMEDVNVFCEVIGNIHDNPELLGGAE